MAKDPAMWTDLAKLLGDLEGEAEENLRAGLAVPGEAGEANGLRPRLEHVFDVRRRYLAEFGEEVFGLYVPVTSPEGSGDFASSLAPGSAVVGVTAEQPFGGRIHVCYEGNLYGAANLADFGGRASCAADRLRTGYPTVARAMVGAEELMLVGRVRPGYAVEPFADAGSRAALAA